MELHCFVTFNPTILIYFVVGNWLEKEKLNLKQGEQKDKKESKKQTQAVEWEDTVFFWKISYVG